MASLNSYNLEGLKENFANWIATITPDKTPFISSIGIDPSNGTDFKWLADRYSYTDNFEAAEPSKEGDASVGTTYNLTRPMEQYENYTQIFRRVIRISDTALNSSVYGREDELAYQIAKAGIDIKKEMEYRFLSKQTKREGSDSAGARTAGFMAQCAPLTPLNGKDFPTDNTNADPQTGAITTISVKDIADITPEIVNQLTENLFNSGAETCHILYNPRTNEIGELFRKMSDGDATTPSRTRLQWFYTDKNGESKEYMTYTDAIGQNYRLIPNYWMPEDTIYFFSPDDWDMVVYREPAPKQIDSNGSYQVWLVECEIGLRHAHKYASGVITKE